MGKRFLMIAALLFSAVVSHGEELKFHKATDPQIRVVARSVECGDGAIKFDWSGSYFEFNIDGGVVAMQMKDSKMSCFNIFVDGVFNRMVNNSTTDSLITIIDRLPRGEYTIRVQKRSEGQQGCTTLSGISLSGNLLAAPSAPARHIEFIGDSHTCGYGTEGVNAHEHFKTETENCNIAWGCILSRYFDADYTLIAHSGIGIVRNYGDSKAVSDYTMRERAFQTLNMESEPKWDFSKRKVDLVVIKLGTNDCSGGKTPTMANYNASYKILIDGLRKNYGADMPILCVAPAGDDPLYGYLQQFCKDMNDQNLHVAAMTKEVVNGDSELGSDYHPNYVGQRKMAMSIAPYISTIMGWGMPLRVVE